MSYRLERLNSEMKKCIADIIRFKIGDPRVSGMVSVLDVNVSKDLKTAKVRVSVFGEKTDEAMDALNKSLGFIRKEVSVAFKDIRCVPAFTFILDTSLEYSQHIGKLLEQIKNDGTESE